MKDPTRNKITIFSKNRITLVSEKNDTAPPRTYVYSKYGLSGTLLIGDTRLKAKERKTKTIATETKIKCKSPLGFYYWKPETIRTEVPDDKTPNPHVEVQEIILVTKRNTYTLIFPISQGGVTISTETRPWNIVSGYKSMPDHFISDLHSDLETIFSELRQDKAVVMTKTNEWDFENRSYKMKISPIGLGEFKNNLYLEIFGNSKGPVEQTNDEKILAHGFDLKTSFRKDPEK